MDKSKPPRSQTRIEVWVDFRDEENKNKLGTILTKFASDPRIGGKIQDKVEWKDHVAY